MQHGVDHKRWPRGSKHWNTKLTEEQARRVKFSGEPPSVLARELGCSHGAIMGIRRGKSWAWLEHN
jgi:hypothetical protein